MWERQLIWQLNYQVAMPVNCAVERLFLSVTTRRSANPVIVWNPKVQHLLQNSLDPEQCAKPIKFSPLTYLLTPCCRVLLEKLTGLQLVKKFPAFQGTRRFITALTIVRHLSLSWASPIQFIYPHPTYCRSILVLSTHLRLGLPSGIISAHFLH